MNVMFFFLGYHSNVVVNKIIFLFLSVQVYHSNFVLNWLNFCFFSVQVCDFRRDCDPGFTDEKHCGTCDFETDLCGFTDTSTGAVSWKQATDADTPDIKTRFGADHTLKSTSGHFMYVSRSNGTRNSLATLVSPLLQPTYETCQFKFFYKKQSAGDLKVDIAVSVFVLVK